jgi:hypothetical protein
MKRSIIKILASVILIAWSSLSIAWDSEELMGAWQAEESGVNATTTVIGKEYAAYVLINGEYKPFKYNQATEVEMENEWLDEEKARMRYWVLDENQERTDVSGVSRRR